MNLIFDLLGSAVIASLLILMMMTFQLQLRDTAQRTLYAASMVDHMDVACRKLNSVVALAGIGMPPDSTVTVAATNRMVFRTYWDYMNDVLTVQRRTVEIKLVDSGTEYGQVLSIVQDGEVLPEPYIFYIEAIEMRYYNKLDQVTTTARLARSVDMMLTFRRDTPAPNVRQLRSKVQIKCYLMNSYMRGA